MTTEERWPRLSGLESPGYSTGRRSERQVQVDQLFEVVHALLGRVSMLEQRLLAVEARHAEP